MNKQKELNLSYLLGATFGSTVYFLHFECILQDQILTNITSLKWALCVLFAFFKVFISVVWNIYL